MSCTNNQEHINGFTDSTMEWNFLKEIESNFIFSSDPGVLVDPSFDTIQPLTTCNSNQWVGTTSTSFEQFASYNFVPNFLLEDPGVDSWRSTNTSYDLVPTWSENIAFDVSKLDTLEKGPSQMVSGSGCEGANSLCFNDCHEDIKDCKMLGLDEVDDNFMNTLSEEDIRAVLNTVEPSQQVVNQCNKPEPFEDILENLLNDPRNNIMYQNATAATKNLDAFGTSLLSEDLSVKSSMMSQGSMASDSSTFVKPRGSITRSRGLGVDVTKAKILEATVLRELEAALSVITESTRICFRDACYRLANESKVPRDGSKREFPEFHFETSFNLSSRAYKGEPVEKETNVVDRTIMNLLLNPPCNGSSGMWAP